MEQGVDPGKIAHFSVLPAQEISELLLNNGARSLESQSFLEMVLQKTCYMDDESQQSPTDSTCVKQKIELINLALAKGADPNYQEIITLALSNPLILELLLNNKYNKLNPDLVSKFFYAYINAYWIENGLDYLLTTPSQLLNIKYKNLNAKVLPDNKIPLIVHHVWLTNKEQKKKCLWLS